MGSAKLSNVNIILPMEEEKRSIRTILRDIFRRNKKKEKPKIEVVEQNLKPIVEITVQSILEKLKKAEIKENNDDESAKLAIRTIPVDKENRLKCSDCKIVERDTRIDSQSSEDSGFSEKGVLEDNKQDDEVVEVLKNMSIGEENKKERRVQTVFVPRGPARRTAGDFAKPVKTIKPYHVPTETTTQVVEQKQNPIEEVTVHTIQKKLKKVEIIEDKDDKSTNLTVRTIPVDNENRSKCTDCKIVERDTRIDSQSSGASGFSEKGVSEDIKRDDEVAEGLKNMSIVEKKKKEKRLQTVFLPRGPARRKDFAKPAKPTEPYHVPTETTAQIKINRNILAGGQMICNVTNLENRIHPICNDAQELDNAINTVTQMNTRNACGPDWMGIVTDFIQDESSKPTETLAPLSTFEDILAEFSFESEHQSVILTPPHQIPEPAPEPNPIEEFSNNLSHETFDSIDINSLEVDRILDAPGSSSIFPTPPYSENAPSPMSEQSMYKTSEYPYSPSLSASLSSELASPIFNGDFEKFQEIAQYDDTSAHTSIPSSDGKRQRTNSTSSMTMKMFKDQQKDICRHFAEKDCCQMTRKTCKEMFQEYLQKLPKDDRWGICFKVAKFDLNYAHGVLQRTMINLAEGSEQDNLLMTLFYLICEKVLCQQPAWFVEDFGLNQLQSAVLRCFNRPLLTRYLVHCVRSVIRNNPSLVQGRESVFHEVDALGDTLVTACARRGDACADSLAALMGSSDQLPLFRINHVNADGASALHVACSEHSASASRLHVVHVLLEHARADLWQGDSKAGDTALHMAVNSKTCDLRLVLLIFRYLDRKDWKKLAHAQNMCFTTPIIYARTAQSAQTRVFPSEVLDFLKKCR